jgi:hypothetical protein
MLSLPPKPLSLLVILALSPANPAQLIVSTHDSQAIGESPCGHILGELAQLKFANVIGLGPGRDDSTIRTGSPRVGPSPIGDGW